MKTDKILFITLAISMLASLGFAPSVLAQTNSTNALNATGSDMQNTSKIHFVPIPGQPGHYYIEQFIPPDQFLAQNPHPSDQQVTQWQYACDVTGHTPDYCAYNAAQMAISQLPHEQICRDLLPQYLAAHGCPVPTARLVSSGGGTSGHTPEYKLGFTAGRTDALNSGIYDVGSSCGGYSATQCNHYIAGYHDGYHVACGKSKFVDACSGNAPGTLKSSSSSNSCTSEGCNGDYTCVNPNQPPGVPGCPNDYNGNNND